MTQRTKIVDLIGFAPDVDPTVQGAMLDVKHLIPTQRGFKGQPWWTKQKNNTAAPVGYLKFTISEKASSSLHDYVFVTDAGSTATWLYGRDVASSDWTNLSDTAGFTGSPSYGGIVWTRMGDYQVMYVTGSTGLRQRNAPLTQGFASGQKVSTITGAPSAVNALVSAERFVMALGPTHDGATASGDGWYCSARDDHSSWTVSQTTLCAYGRLVSSSGEIRAGIEFYNDVLAFKAESMYRGRFVAGSDEVWVWDKLPYAVGCIGPHAVCKVDETIAFVHTSGVYLYDGAQIAPLMPNFTDWLSQASPAMVTDGDFGAYDLYRQLLTTRYAHLRYDNIHKLLYLTYPSTSVRASYGLVCHVPTRKWTKVRFGGTTVDNGWMYAAPQSSNFVSTMVSASNESTVSGTVVLNYMVHGTLNGASTHYDATLSPLSAATASGAVSTIPSFTLNDFGDDYDELELTEARIRFITSPSGATCTPSYRNTLDGTATTAASATMSGDGKFDLRQNARWHRLTFTFTDDTARPEFTGLRLTFNDNASRGEG